MEQIRANIWFLAKKHLKICPKWRVFAVLGLNEIVRVGSNKVFNLSIIRKNNLLFDQTLKMGENLDFCIKYLEKIKFITVLDKYLYYYDRTNNQSLTNSNIKSLPERTKINIDNIKKFLERNNIDGNDFNTYKKEQFIYVESKIKNSTITRKEKDNLLSKNIILNMN